MSTAITVFLASTLTPLIMALWGKLSPVREISEWEPSFEYLAKRNRLLNGIACVLCLIGICVPLPLMNYVPEQVHMWCAALGFGLMIILPVLFISIVTLPKGISRFYEFWRYYELTYNIGIKGIMVVYIPFMLLGIISAYEITKSI